MKIQPQRADRETVDAKEAFFLSVSFIHCVCCRETHTLMKDYIVILVYFKILLVNVRKLWPLCQCYL